MFLVAPRGRAPPSMGPTQEAGLSADDSGRGPRGGASILLPAGQADRLGLVDWFDCTPGPSVPMLQLGGATSLRRVHLKTFHCSSTLVG